MPKHIFRLTAERMAAWHRFAEASHSAQQASQCPVCQRQAGVMSGSVFGEWLESHGLEVVTVQDEALEIQCNPGGQDNTLYRLIAGTGDWV